MMYILQACKNFKNGDECVEMCPPMEIYDKVQFKRVPNPNAKYAYGTLCVPKCPGELECMLLIYGQWVETWWLAEK